ncbi:MAG: hypothetical protein QM500_12250 [Methylococcales bacterium]
MNKYNLDAQFSALSTKQIQKMVTSRLTKESDISEQITELEIKQEKTFSDDYYDSLQTKIDRFQNQLDDISDWMAAAKPLFSKTLWNELVDNNQSWMHESTNENLFSEANVQHLAKIYDILSKKTWADGTDLLKDMIEKADESESYAADFQQWINASEGQTLILRQLTEGFRSNYTNDLDHFNATHSIDSASAILVQEKHNAQVHTEFDGDLDNYRNHVEAIGDSPNHLTNQNAIKN